MPEVHAKVSPSGIKQWSNCTVSLKLSEGIPDVGSPFAAEGTVAHSLGEAKINAKYKALDLTDVLDQIRRNDLYTAEMESATDEYLDHVVETYNACVNENPYIVTEQQVDLRKWIPNGFGTADCIIIDADTIHVIDLKYGKGVVVNAEENGQLSLYALGALDRYLMFYPDLQRVVLHICQPRAGGVSTWTTSVAALLMWGETIKPLALAAYRGEGKPNPGADTCRWCKVKGTCRARLCWLIKAMASEEWQESKPLLDADEIGELLTIAEPVVSWLTDLKAEAESKLMQGVPVKGYKLVRGRTNRAWKDQTEAFKAIVAAGTPEEMLWERTPLTVAKVEKVVGKKQFNEFSDYVIKTEGKPTMVAASDKREEYIPNSVSGALDQFIEKPAG